VRAYPFTDEITKFIDAHERIYVVEQNRDAQLALLLKLELTPDQITRLQTAGDAFKLRSDSLIDKVANILGDSTQKNPDPMTIFAKLQPSMTEGRKLATQAITDAKAILTPAQWAKVPDRIKTPGLRREGGGEGRFDRGGPGN